MIVTHHQKDIIVGLHVDEMIVIVRCPQIKKFKEKISNAIKIKDLGPASLILSTRVRRESDGTVKIDQQKYIESVLEEFEMEARYGHPAPLSTEKREPWSEENNFEDNTKYRQAIGSILYASGRTRPDLAVAVSRQGQYCEQPTQQDWNHVNQRRGRQIEVYVDADWAGDSEDAVSVSGCHQVSKWCN